MDTEKIINILTELLEDYKTLFNYTREIKRTLSENYNENILEKNIIKRGLLINKITSTAKYYNTIKGCSNFADNIKWKARANEVLQEIQQLLDNTILLDNGIASIIKQRIRDVTFDLEKIQEGKHFVDSLKKHFNVTPSFIDICG